MMDDAADVDDLVRAVRARVPVDAAALLAKHSPEERRRVLAALPPDFAVRVAALLPDAIEGDTDAMVPGLTRELIEPVRGALAPDTTAGEAIEWLRQAETVSEITYLYVVDAMQRLVGLVVMRDLLLARPEQRLAELMLPDPFALAPDMPVRDAVEAAIKRHYPVYPVCDETGTLVGLVRGWRLFERQAVEITAQTGQMVGVDKEERVYTGLWPAFRLRHPWLQLNLLTAFLAALIVGLFEDTISRTVALAAFLPVVAGQSGNNGCQALAITLRGITLGDMGTHPVRRLIAKEVTLGAVNGALTGCIAGLAMWWTVQRAGHPHAAVLGLVILLAMCGACMASGLFGVLVPVLLRRAGADPATASSIFLTTGTDIAGMGLMLALATMLIP
jgi:magnesium transporter